VVKKGVFVQEKKKKHGNTPNQQGTRSPTHPRESPRAKNNVWSPTGTNDPKTRPKKTQKTKGVWTAGVEKGQKTDSPWLKTRKKSKRIKKKKGIGGDVSLKYYRAPRKLKAFCGLSKGRGKKK